jgi:hypothetical protein
MPDNERLATIPEVRDWFGLSSKEMAAEWKLLSTQDRLELKTGIGNGTLTY